MKQWWHGVWLLWVLILAVGCAPTAAEQADGALAVPTVLANGASPAQTATPFLPAPVTTAVATPDEPTATPEAADSALEVLGGLIPPLPGAYAPTSSLLFISDGWLQLWSAADGSVTRFLGPATGADSELGAVVSFHTDDSGQRIAAVRRTTVVPEQFELLTLTVNNPTPQVIARNLLEIRSYRVSPDGTRIAYTPVVPRAPDVNTLLAPLTIFVAPAAGGEPRPFAECTQAPAADADPEGRGLYSTLCGPLLWTLDSQHLVWPDGDGLRTRGLLANVTYTLIDHNFAPPMGDGPSVYVPQSWAPGGRYMLMDVSHWEHRTQAIFDFNDRRLLPVPHVLVGYSLPQAYVAWMADDRLFMVRKTDSAGEFMAEIYRIPESGDGLIAEESTWVGQSGTEILAPHHHGDGRFGATFWRRDGLGQSGLLTLTSLSAVERQLLPVYAPAGVDFLPNWVRWNDAGTLALIAMPASYGGDARPLLADLSREVAYDAAALLGSRLQQGQWLP